MSGAPSIEVDAITKRFRLYHERNQTLKAAVLRGRRARYDEFLALKNVSFDVAQGVTFGLIGENGSGKSTLLKCIAKILYPDAGEIRTNGKISALLELGAGFHPELSGRENVFLNGAILGLSRRQLDERFDDIVAFAGIEQFIDSPVKTYSSGMYVRLGFSVAINVDPEILLIDEVLAVGDAEFQQRCTDKITEFKREGRTIVIVSHSMSSVQNLCDQVALLEHGHLVTVGTPVEVIDEYLTDVFHDREFDSDSGGRWGSGEIRIDRIELLDGEGAPARHIATGDAVLFRLHCRAQQPVDRPLFGVAIHTVDGTYVSGPNTRDAELFLDDVSGERVIDLRIDHLMLAPGSYDVTAAIHDETGTHPYDFRSKVIRFDVELGTPRESFGVMSVGGRWSVRAPEERAADRLP